MKACYNLLMMEHWDNTAHRISFNENVDAEGNYMAEILCDEKSVYRMEKPALNRFSLMRSHDAFLKVVETYQKTGRLPTHAGLLKNIHFTG